MVRERTAWTESRTTRCPLSGPGPIEGCHSEWPLGGCLSGKGKTKFRSLNHNRKPVFHINQPSQTRWETRNGRPT